MSGHGYEREILSPSTTNRSLKVLAQSGYYFIIALVLFTAFIREATGNVENVFFQATPVAIRHPVSDSCQIPASGNERDTLTCAPDLNSTGLINWKQLLNSTRSLTDPNSSKEKGESHDYN